MDILNQSLSEDGIDMFVMGFHPESDENELLENSLEMTDDNSYAMIFLQRLTKLQEASNVLRKKDTTMFVKIITRTNLCMN